MELSRGGSVLGGMLLVAGTAIGGGMLALPVLTAAGGFIPATATFIVCWLFMAATALLMLECVLWSPAETNLISMARKTLGRPGKILTWVFYIYLFYSLTIAYVSGGGQLLVEVLHAMGYVQVAPWMGPLLFTALFAPLVAIGAKVVDRVNRVLMLGLFISFFVFILLGISHIDVRLLLRTHWVSSFGGLPIIFTAFAFQGVVPTLTTYLDRDYLKIKKAIVWGSAIPLVIYIVWEALILVLIQVNALEWARVLGQSAVSPLKERLDFPWLFRIGEFFAAFAIITSFLGVTLGLLDFLADGLRVEKNVRGRVFLSALIFLPPLFFSLKNPALFLWALQYAGGIGCAFLLGLLPIVMVWRGRYMLGFESREKLAGGRFSLTLLFLFIMVEFLLLLVKIA